MFLSTPFIHQNIKKSDADYYITACICQTQFKVVQGNVRFMVMDFCHFMSLVSPRQKVIHCFRMIAILIPTAICFGDNVTSRSRLY